MNAFLFQSIASRFDLRNEMLPGKRDVWYATRYRNEMNPGDLVFFWMGGEKDLRGLYGLGHLASKPYLKPSWDSFGVDVLYDEKLNQPILATSLVRDQRLSGMLVFRAPQATNFMLRPEEAEGIIQYMKKHGERAPALEVKNNG